MALRDYQSNAITEVERKWAAGVRSVCLVAQTGAGKTRTAQAIVESELARGNHVLFTVPRRDLVRQTRDIFIAAFGRLDVGVIAPGYDYDPHSPVQISTIQTLTSRLQSEKPLPQSDVVIHDEAHHAIATEWVKVSDFYSSARMLGLTATPERIDGKPLGDLFQDLVVATSYSALLTAGFLVPCKVYQPPDIMGSDLAQDPVAAYQRYTPGSRAFCFCGSIEQAEDLATRFSEAGIPAAAITANTKSRDRDERIAKFSSGELSVLTNAFALTEGIDVPAAQTVILARNCTHITPYLQMCGRVLRPHPSKQYAVLIDLSGASLVHGLPTEDREYSLEGKGIKRTTLTPLKVCPKCGATIISAYRECPECGWVFAQEKRPDIKIWDLELKEVYAGAATPDDAKQREYRRLRELGREKGWGLYFIQKEFKKLFGELPVIHDATVDEMRGEYARLAGVATRNGFKPGYVKINFKNMFGRWPDRRVTSGATGT